MKRSSLRSFCVLALLISFLMSAKSSAAPTSVTLDTSGNVRSFYGIPITLTRAGLKRLPYRMRKGHLYAEGDRYTNYRITAQAKVEVVVAFERNGKLYDAWTESHNAFGPKRIGVGSTLADVRAAWPKGMLLFGNEDGAFVTYVTGTNVLFRFDPKDMPPGAFNHDRPRDFPVPDNIKVQKISIYPKPNPVPKGAKPIDLSKNSTTVEIAGKIVARLDVERTPDSPLVRLTWTHEGKVERDALIDVSKFPDFDFWSRDLIHDPQPVVVAFRYGSFKNCAVMQDDRDRVYVTFDSAGATLSASPPQGVAAPEERWAQPKYVGNLMNSAAHGCRRTYDPRTGAFGLEKAE